MTLENLTTPFEKRRVIEYGVDGNKAVRHWHDVQHVAGPIYKGREQTDRWGETRFTLYLFYPGVPCGLVHCKGLTNPERYTVERLMENLKLYRDETLEQLVENFDTWAKDGRWIGNVHIEFVRQFDPERAAYYAECKAAYKARQAEQEAERLRKIAKQEAREKAEQEAEKQAQRSLYLGWADDLTPLQFGRADKMLNKMTRNNGKVMTKRDFIISTVRDGWMPRQVTVYGKRNVEHRLEKDGYFYLVNKTEYDFARFLAYRKEV